MPTHLTPTASANPLPPNLLAAQEGAIGLASLADSILNMLTRSNHAAEPGATEGDEQHGDTGESPPDRQILYVDAMEVAHKVAELRKKSEAYIAAIEAVAPELRVERDANDPFRFGEIIAPSAHEAAMDLAVEIHGRVWFAATLEFVRLESTSMDLTRITEKYDDVRLHFAEQGPVYPDVQELIAAIKEEAAQAAGRRPDQTGGAAGGKAGNGKRKGGKPPLEKSANQKDKLKLQIYERIQRLKNGGSRPAEILKRLKGEKDFMEQVKEAGLTLNMPLLNAAKAFYNQPNRKMKETQSS
jgi:hypothetical protein